MSESSESNYDRIVRLTDEWLGSDKNCDGFPIQELDGSRKDLRWLAELFDNGNKLASMPTVNYRRNVTGSEKTLAEMSDPKLEEVLAGLEKAIQDRDSE